MKQKTAVIDADSMIFIVTHCKKKWNKDETPVLDDLGEQVIEIKSLQDCKDEMDKLVYGMLAKTGATDYVMYLTVGKGFRYTLYPEYKGNRKSGEKPKWFDEVKEYLITNYGACYNMNLEADDLVNITKNQVDNSFICAIDKDLLSLEGRHFNYSKFEWVETSKDDAMYKFWTDMITGQSGDNVKGIPGKGPKYAEKVLVNYDYSIPTLNYDCLVLNEYIAHFGEYLGIQEFYKNYMVLKIKDNLDGFVLPVLNQFERKKTDEPKERVE